MSREIKLIDQIVTELAVKNILGEVVHIVLTKSSLEELKEEYFEEFQNELKDTGRGTSVRDLEDYFGISIVVSDIKDGGKYQLLTKI